MKRAWQISAGIVLAAILAVGGLVLYAFQHGHLDNWARNLIVSRIEQATGAKVQLGGFYLRVWGLRVELRDFTLHGSEAPGRPPLFHADSVQVGARLVSLFSRKIVLTDVLLEHPQISVNINRFGKSNVPTPAVRNAQNPPLQQLFNLQIGRLALQHGNIEFNNEKAPLAADVRDFHFAMYYIPLQSAAPAYAGDVAWKGMELTTPHYMPFHSDVSARFRLTEQAFSLDDLDWKLPNSDLEVRADLPSFARPLWNVHFRGSLSFEDLRTLLRKPSVPSGLVDFTGAGQYEDGKWSAKGHYRASQIAMRYQWFHAGGIETWGDFEAQPSRIVVPQFDSRALGGSLSGRLEMDLSTLAFRVQSRMQGASLDAALNAVNNPHLPVSTFHWNGLLNVDSVTTWIADFKHFRTIGTSQWSPPPHLLPRQIPASAKIGFDYEMDREHVSLSNSTISTPTTQIGFKGIIGAADTALDLQFNTKDLTPWDEFINTLRGPDATPETISGQAMWNGRLLGAIVSPIFSGQAHVLDGHYGRLSWDEVEGDMEYSADDLKLMHMKARHGRSAIATLDLTLQFDGEWGFLPTSPWSLDAVTYRASISELQDFFALNYPLKGILSGDIRASGTRAATVYQANFTIDDGEAHGFPFDRMSGQFGMQDDEIRISHAELRKGTGRMTGDVLYHPNEKDTVFHIAAADIPLENIQRLQTPALPIAGRLTLDIKGQGPIAAPVGQGTLQVTSLKLGAEQQGDFLGRIRSDGGVVNLDIDSVLTKGKLDGHVALTLNDALAVSGEVDIAKFDLDPLIIAALHLDQLTGHSSFDGKFRLSGSLRQPDTLEADADLSSASFDYEHVKLENVSPVRLSYRRNEVHIDQGEFRGAETDMRVSGSVRFDNDRPLNIGLAGSVNLQLVAGFVPNLQSTGQAQMDVSIDGTFDRPRISGRATFADVSAHYGEFPTGLSHINGQILFTRNRLLFDNVKAEAGGGQVTLGGSLTFGDLPVQYQVNVNAPKVIIRYPEGVSWQAGGKLVLAGTREGGLISGNVQLERLLLNQGIDLSTIFGSTEETVLSGGPGASSQYLRNLQFDVTGNTTANTQLQWPSAHVEIDGDIRLRGTWDRPLLLGHVHLISGEMAFRGNSYRLTRGDVDFSNPFRIDPILNVEATANISQYQVTVDFTGAASRLTLSYRSDPPLPDSDIVALLAIGQTGEESALRSSTSGSQNYGATALLSEAISSQLGGRIEHLFGITNFRVDPFLAGTTTEQNAAARVTIQKQVTRDLVVTYSTNASSDQYQVIQVEYTVRRDTSVIFLRDINDTYSFTVELRKHFK